MIVVPPTSLEKLNVVLLEFAKKMLLGQALLQPNCTRVKLEKKEVIQSLCSVPKNTVLTEKREATATGVTDRLVLKLDHNHPESAARICTAPYCISSPVETLGPGASNIDRLSEVETSFEGTWDELRIIGNEL